MTFGDLDKALPENSEQSKETQSTPFDWTSETYQLMCREYRMSLGIVHPTNYESRYETGSEYLYWENLYKVRGYGPYERKRYYMETQVVLHVLPDPPDAWQLEWAAKHGRNITIDDNTSKATAITAEQEATGQEYLKRLEGACIKDEKGEITAITDASVLSEFQIWMAKEGLRVTEDVANLIIDSWAPFFEEDRKALAAKSTVHSSSDSGPYQEFD